ncbi:MAG: DUF721 domain-containing protein [Coriobacteriia bacterium]|nr:DUF721 domain-containing protein [Coriobacteriia bacterium]
MNSEYDYVFEEYDLDKVSKTSPLGIEVSKLMGRLDPDGSMSADGPSISAVQSAWNDVAGSQVADITRSVYIRNDEVVVILSSSIWAQELGFLSGEYCKKLNEVLGTDFLKKVSFRVK